MDIIKVFNQYINDIKKVISNANGYLVENELDDQNKIFDKVSREALYLNILINFDYA
ncbi:hypothetical protein V7182_11900 [Neobacillus drentensis]|uniref:hypothetical protein n=1 Tax=Neobacillus drentensis TaxID=220684 RepID=UPI002FFEDE33